MKLNNLQQISTQAVSHNPEIQKKVMLNSEDMPHLTNFSQARFAPGQIAINHSHSDMYEVFFVQSGTAIICLDGKEIKLTPGSCIMVEPGEEHQITNTGTNELVLNYFGIQK